MEKGQFGSGKFSPHVSLIGSPQTIETVGKSQRALNWKNLIGSPQTITSAGKPSSRNWKNLNGAPQTITTVGESDNRNWKNANGVPKTIAVASPNANWYVNAGGVSSNSKYGFGTKTGNSVFASFTGTDIAQLGAKLPSEFPTNYFADAIDNPNITIADLQKALDKANYWVSEYQRQIQVHLTVKTPTSDSEAEGVKNEWLPVAVAAQQALSDKLTAYKATPAGTKPTYTPKSGDTTTGMGMGAKIGIGLGIVAVVGTALFFILRRRG